MITKRILSAKDYEWRTYTSGIRTRLVSKDQKYSLLLSRNANFGIIKIEHKVKDEYKVISNPFAITIIFNIDEKTFKRLMDRSKPSTLAKAKRNLS